MPDVTFPPVPRRMRAAGSRRRALRVAGATAALVAALPTAGAHAATIAATPATFPGVFSAAQPGDVIELASGDYGTFRGGVKSGLVTITRQPGATPTMGLEFRPAVNIRIDGLTLTGANLDGATRDVTVANSTFTGTVVIRTAQFNNANVVFDGNRHADINVCSSCHEGRITLPGSGPNPSGVTIKNSTFGPGGSSDGIQNGSNGTLIQGNEFLGIQQGDPSVAHSDPIQLYGSRNTVVRGNYIHDTASGIMSGDGTERETIEDNVIVRTGNAPIILGPDDGSIVRHNTLGGTLRVCDSSGSGTCNDPRRASTGTVVVDNVMGTFWANGSPSFAQRDYNLIGSMQPSTMALGPHDLRGRPTFVGGAAPTSMAGFALAPGSTGKGSASDGGDRGARFGAAPGAAAPPTAAAPPAAAVPPVVGPAGLATLLSGRAPGALVAAFGFDERSGARVLDTSGRDNHGRKIGPRRTARGKLGRALDFDGVDDYVTVPDSAALDLTTGMTMEAWVRPTSRGTARRQILAKETGRGPAYGLFASTRGRSSGVLSVKRAGATATTRLRLRRWSHVATTFDGRALRLYVNGRLVRKHATRTALRPSNGPLKIGGDAVRGGNFRGTIDAVRVYDRALSAADIRRDMRRR